MDGTRKNEPLSWSELAALVMFGFMVLFGLVANERTFLQSLVAVGVWAALLFVAWLWQVTCRKEQRPLTRGEWWWNVAVFVSCLATIAIIAWWFSVD